MIYYIIEIKCIATSANPGFAKDTVKIAQQSVLIGIAVGVVLMFIASFGLIPAFIGAMFQEVVDVIAIVSALRAHRN